MLPDVKPSLVLQKIGDETLVYDGDEQKALCLSETGSLVIEACINKAEQSALLDELRRRQVADAEGALQQTLAQFSEEGLLVNNSEKSFDRRSFMMAAGAAAALPVVMSVLAPRPAHATSCNNCDVVGFLGPPADCSQCGDNCPAGASCAGTARCCFEYRLLNLTFSAACVPGEILGTFGCRNIPGEPFATSCAAAREAARTAPGAAVFDRYYCCTCAGSTPNTCP